MWLNFSGGKKGGVMHDFNSSQLKKTYFDLKFFLCVYVD